MITLADVPMMNPKETMALRLLIGTRKPKRVLEWGAGASTLYFPKYFPSVEWLSVEHNADYAEAVAKQLPPNVTLLRLDFPEYYQLTSNEVGKFDLIIVDGRKRVRCLDAARELLNPGGAVVLHDSGRARYAPAKEFYKEMKTLVDPTPTKDPRGLAMFTKPIAAESRVMALPERGVVYLCWGEPACQQIDASLASLRKHVPGMPAFIIGDAGAVSYFQHRENILTHLCEVDPFKSASLFGFHAGRVKPLMARLSPFNQSLYVDADTEFKTTPLHGFDLLSKWDVVIAEAETRSLAITFPDNRVEAKETAAWLGTPHILYHNSGMIFWRRSPAVTVLFDLWKIEWQRYRGWDEQVALLRALLKSPRVLFLNVPYTWNCRGPQEAYMVYHRFASRAARKYRGATSAPVVTNPRQPMMAPSRPLVRVEVSPGCFVKVHQGDEEKAREAWRLSHGVKR